MFEQTARTPGGASQRPSGWAILAHGLVGLIAAAAFAQAPATPVETPAAPAGPAPKLVVVEPIYDAGTVSKGERLKVDFVLENQGDGPLEITAARPSCGCTVASFDRTIAPGGTGKVHAELDTTDFQGAIAKSITVLSSDAANPQVVLTIKVKVEAHIGVHPGYARYIYVQTLDPGTLAQTLWALDGKDFTITEVRSPYKFIKASFREANESERRPDATGRQWQIEMTIQPDADVGPLREFLIVETTHPVQPEVRIPISGFVRPLMHATPQEANFGAVQVGDGQLHSVALTFVNFGEQEITIDSLETGVPGIEAKAEATEAGRRFKITVTLGPEVKKGALSTKLKIKTSSAAQPVYEVPIRGTISG